VWSCARTTTVAVDTSLRRAGMTSRPSPASRRRSPCSVGRRVSRDRPPATCHADMGDRPRGAHGRHLPTAPARHHPNSRRRRHRPVCHQSTRCRGDRTRDRCDLDEGGGYLPRAVHGLQPRHPHRDPTPEHLSGTSGPDGGGSVRARRSLTIGVVGRPGRCVIAVCECRRRSCSRLQSRCRPQVRRRA
jgi:hypothetical protein